MELDVMVWQSEQSWREDCFYFHHAVTSLAPFAKSNTGMSRPILFHSIHDVTFSKRPDRRQCVCVCSQERAHFAAIESLAQAAFSLRTCQTWHLPEVGARFRENEEKLRLSKTKIGILHRQMNRQAMYTDT
jgi:hypothetical protein